MSGVLHFFTGYPMVIGLQHIEDYKEIKVSNEEDSKNFKKENGEVLSGFGVMHGFHHYVITTRPRCMFLEKGFYWDPVRKTAVGYMEFEIGYKKYAQAPFKLCFDDSPYPFPRMLDMSSPKDIEEIKISQSETGHPNRLIFKTKGDNYGYFLEPDLLHFIQVDNKQDPELLDFQVEYIGISTGKTGDRDFVDRLWNHEKVVQISGEIQRSSPNLQVYVFGYQASYLIESAPEKFILNSRILENNLGIHKTAQVLEASLIQHFKPAYNKDLLNFMKSEFPKWLSELKRSLDGGFSNDWIISTIMPSDCRYNPNAKWRFGGFYSKETKRLGRRTDLALIELPLSLSSSKI